MVPAGCADEAESDAAGGQRAGGADDRPASGHPADGDRAPDGGGGPGQISVPLDRSGVVGQRPGHVVDYGHHEVASDSLGVEQALMVALREMKEMFAEGWPKGRVEGDRVLPEQVFIDSGFTAPAVYAFCRESGERFRPAIGRGAAQQHHQWYNRPTQTGSICRLIGEGYHVNLLPAEKLYLVQIDSDHWKTWVHQRLSTPMDKPGAMTLFHALPQEHLALAKHLTAEAKMEEYVPGKGTVTRWERIRRSNHWFDALYNACAAGHGCGVRLVQEESREPPKIEPSRNSVISARDGWRPGSAGDPETCRRDDTFD